METWEFHSFFTGSHTATAGRLTGFLILTVNLLAGHQRIGLQLAAIQIFLPQIHRRDLMILIRGVIINPLIGVAAGGILGKLQTAFAGIAAAPGLADSTKNVEKLADALAFRLARFRLTAFPTFLPVTMPSRLAVPCRSLT